VDSMSAPTYHVAVAETTAWRRRPWRMALARFSLGAVGERSNFRRSVNAISSRSLRAIHAAVQGDRGRLARCRVDDWAAPIGITDKLIGDIEREARTRVPAKAGGDVIAPGFRKQPTAPCAWTGTSKLSEDAVSHSASWKPFIQSERLRRPGP
jgi:hypothetical protein